MKRVFGDGTAVQRFTPRDFVVRLCALVPPPRTHMVRYADVVRQILDHLGVPPRPKPRSQPERPPRPLSLFGDLAIDPPSLFN